MIPSSCNLNESQKHFQSVPEVNLRVKSSSDVKVAPISKVYLEGTGDVYQKNVVQNIDKSISRPRNFALIGGIALTTISLATILAMVYQGEKFSFGISFNASLKP